MMFGCFALTLAPLESLMRTEAETRTSADEAKANSPR
jgi:hypothetical protein